MSKPRRGRRTNSIRFAGAFAWQSYFRRSSEFGNREGGNYGKKPMETFGKVIPYLSDLEKEKQLDFGEGMAFKADQQRAEQDSA